MALIEFRRHVKFPRAIWVDQTSATLVDRALVKWLWLVALVRRPNVRFESQPKRWIVERTFGWLNRSRRLAKSYQRTPESDEAFFQVAMIHLMVKRLALGASWIRSQFLCDL